MPNRIEDLPQGIASQVMSFFTERDGELEIHDVSGLVVFIADHAAEYPALLELVRVDENALIEHFKETGELPPGVKLVHTTSAEGSNVTRLEIFRGPLPRRD